ncbi:MAG: hypothetical protein AB1374_04515 [Bacillota bacterium]
MISDRVIYVVEDGFFGPDPPLQLGLNVRKGQTGGMDWIGWHDTNRGHQVEGKLIKETPDGFVWQRYRQVNGKWMKAELIRFRVFTLEEFNKKFRDRVHGPLPEFSSTDELYEFYRREFGSSGCHY